MPRSTAVLLFAALLLPAAAGAQTVAVAEPQATVRSVGKEDLASCKQLWGEALSRTGLATVAAAGKKGQKAPAAEFVASLAVNRDGDAVVFTGLASRTRLDRWAARYEARAPFADRAAWGAALDTVAGQLASAVRDAPARTAAQPPPRERVKLKHAAPAKGAAAEADGAVEPPEGDAAAPSDEADDAPADATEAPEGE